MLYRFNDCVLNTARFSLHREQVKVEVQPQILKLLVYLIENRDRVVSRSELLDKVFGRSIVTDNALTVRISGVRTAIGDSASAQTMIETVQGRGYRFVARVEASTSVPPQFSDPAEHSESLAFLQELAAKRPSIAVMAFEDIGANGRDTIIARGLAHDVTTGLARTRTALVVARNSAFQFDCGEYDVRDIGAKLGVRYLVSGAVQTSGGSVRVSVALAATNTGQELNSWQYNRKLGDILSLQEEIATEIVGALESEVLRQEMQRSVLMPSCNLDAWSAYHRGLNHMFKFTIRECDEAEKFFRRAIDLEPGVPRPYAGLSFVNYERAYLNIDKNRVNTLQRANALAEQAVSVDPTDPMGHWALSRVHFLAGDLDAALDSIVTATDLNPSYATAQYLYGWIAMQLGDHNHCLERVDLARRLSPYDPLVYGMHGISAMSLALLGRADEAMEHVKRARESQVHYQASAMGVAILALAGQLNQAKESLERVRSVNPDYNVNDFLSVYAFRSDDDVRRITEAFKQTQRLLDRPS